MRTKAQRLAALKRITKEHEREMAKKNRYLTAPLTTRIGRYTLQDLLAVAKSHFMDEDSARRIIATGISSPKRMAVVVRAHEIFRKTSPPYREIAVIEISRSHETIDFFSQDMPIPGDEDLVGWVPLKGYHVLSRKISSWTEFQDLLPYLKRDYP